MTSYTRGNSVTFSVHKDSSYTLTDSDMRAALMHQSILATSEDSKTEKAISINSSGSVLAKAAAEWREDHI
eukprot:CAMPEP_0185574632 /NCGR_PEP_ID=MMETSP0434-20130131/6049_1 /TAXON_ID=626734 ORGANISM="Favella taraikaensis, Strain Fe Narragansett Bay" /NCGR_SAMPLE_ID=MMETSP0434 /ASSEMBLY_ACC=CAM_ASM_000379 /LENGTH=70 /DNA_ID=CAMNT_0028191271 /DNA_START=557 /DNA_END=769 /DNA_ORIENTATION=+